MRTTILEEKNMKNNAIIIDNGKHAIVIDAPNNFDDIMSFLTKNELELRGIFLTHHHYDHITCVDELLAAFPKIKVYMSNLAYQSMMNSTINLENYIGDNKAKFEGINKIEVIQEGVINFENWISIRTILVPGHTPGDTAFYVAEEKMVFTGDAIFSGNSMGRTDLPGSDAKQQIKNVKNKILTLPDDVFIIPGHNYGAYQTIGEAKKIFRY